MNFASMKKPKTLGILGGMGPEATLCLFSLIIKNTDAAKDQEHIPVIIYNNPQIPDRTKHIVYGEESPLPMLIEGAKFLEKSGADAILIPCNTAHFYAPQIKELIAVPIIDMIETTAKFIKDREGESCKVGVLATTGTIRSNLYQKSLAKEGIDSITLSPEEQEELVMEAIYGKKGVKAGFKKYPALLLKEAASLLCDRGAQYIIAGCTEIPLVLTGKELKCNFVNTMELLAREAIKFCDPQKLCKQ